MGGPAGGGPGSGWPSQGGRAGRIGAKVIGVDPASDPPAAPAGVEVRAEPYRAEHLRGVVLAIAAAPAAVNRAVVADARRAGVWVCSASDPGEGDFTVPAVWRDGPLTLTLSTGGATPPSPPRCATGRPGPWDRPPPPGRVLAELGPRCSPACLTPRPAVASWATGPTRVARPLAEQRPRGRPGRAHPRHRTRGRESRTLDLCFLS